MLCNISCKVDLHRKMVFNSHCYFLSAISRFHLYDTVKLLGRNVKIDCGNRKFDSLMPHKIHYTLKQYRWYHLVGTIF